uniref:NADH-ubiquinone oxidoreductase chain 4L n=1 Tax=Otobius megnini TaxID=34606 RepID=W0FDI1_OTOMG|nr:NADH dehydrogenase subunit 4L [Otobius megnini]AHF21635.1 NADH dehydrogenase subunit 4L [Otobius megnini]AIZ58591.1 NADH dehydrogenase subunit 4L [Otobius megnini]UYB78414.1 NADH dehydrogenase subunit 4L [Otobius megnini]
MMIFGGVIYVYGLLGFLMNWKHILVMLLSLEFMYLGVLFSVFLLMSMQENFFNLLVFMVFVVCEAGMGLSVMILGVFFYGNDKFNSLVLMKC